MFPSRLDVLVIGNSSEIRPERLAGCAKATRLGIDAAAGLDEAIAQIVAGDLRPDIIVLAVEWPGQFNTADLERLHRLVPLARIVYRLGSWCQGISTTKTLCEFVPRLGEPAADWGLERISGEMARGVVGCSLSGPATATLDERLDVEISRFQGSGDGWTVTGVVSRDRLFRECVSEALATRGDAPIACADPWDLAGRAQRIVWDLTPWGEGTSREVRAFLDRDSETPILAVLGFPRREHRRELGESGVAMVLAKPFLLSELFWSLDQLCPRRPSNAGLPA
jgi:hypothetical protein